MLSITITFTALSWVFSFLFRVTSKSNWKVLKGHLSYTYSELRQHGSRFYRGRRVNTCKWTINKNSKLEVKNVQLSTRVCIILQGHFLTSKKLCNVASAVRWKATMLECTCMPYMCKRSAVVQSGILSFYKKYRNSENKCNMDVFLHVAACTF